MHYSVEIGLRYLRAKKRSTVSAITAIAFTGVALGVAALLCVMSITAGFQNEFRTKVLGVNAHVLILKYGLDFREYPDVITKVKALPEVAGLAPFEIDEMMLAKGDRLAGVLVKGVDPSAVSNVLDLPHQIIAGSLTGLRRKGAVAPSFRDASAPSPIWKEPAPVGPRTPTHEPAVEVPSLAEVQAALRGNAPALPSDADEARAFGEAHNTASQEEDIPGLIVGVTLAKNLGLHVGDHVQVVSPLAGLDTSFVKSDVRAFAPENKEFRVIGIFEAGFQEYDTRLVYTDLYEAQALANRGDTVTGVEIRLHDLEKAPLVAKAIERMLGTGPYHTLDWEELNHNLFTALEIQKVILTLLIAIITLVAAFTVVATLIMIVLEKKREIAILKAMGAKDSAVLFVFMLQGAVVGLVGTVMGLIAGGGICAYLTTFRYPLDPKVYLIDHLPVRTSAVEFAATIAIAFVICVTATLIPSWWAARLIPSDGIRYQ